MTENQLRQKVVKIAVSYLGCKEADGSHRKIIDLYNSHKPLARGYAVKYTDAWCSTFASAVAIIGALTVLTNIIVEVLKRATWEKMPTNLLAIIVAMVLTLVAFFGYMAFMGYAVMWYYVAAAVVVGFAVAYAAMFGFDKLKEALGQIKKNNE